MEVKEVRLARLQEMLEGHGGSKKALASAIKKKPAQVSQWFAGVRTISEDSARDIERATRMPPGWMDTPPATLVMGGAAPQRLRNYVAEDGAPAWPFPRIDPGAVARLEPEQIRDLEAGMLLIAAQFGFKIQKRRAA
jgi:hypothetical protein